MSRTILMPQICSRKNAERERTSLLLGIALVSFAPFAVAQGTLGELLDAGASKMSAREFKQELVGRPIAGPTPAGNSLEVVYIDNGRISGAGFASLLGGAVGGGASYAVEGSWNDDGEKICTRMQLGRVDLPPRCQFWFKLGEQYFLSDSDSDRLARVFRRIVKR
jgi:hypothetical protein